MVRVCPNRHENPDGSAFCNVCGSPITAPVDSLIDTNPRLLVSEESSLEDDANPSHIPEVASKRGFVEKFLAWLGLASSPRPKWLIPTLIAAPVAVALAIVLGIILPIVSHPTHHLQGVLALYQDPSSSLDPDISGDWESCKGTGGYDDFQAGSPATIRNGKGEIVGSLTVSNFDAQTRDAMLAADQKYGFAGWGEDLELDKTLIEESASSGLLCLLYVSGDIQDSDYYTFTFSHRGDLSYSRADLAEEGWWLSLSLGDS